MFFRKRKARREPALGTFGTLFAFGLNARDRIGADGCRRARSAGAAQREQEAAPQEAPPRHASPASLLELRARALGRARAHRLRRLPSLAAAAARDAGGADAPADRLHPRHRRQGDRDPRRHGRRRHSAQGATAVSAAGGHRHRGPPFLLSLRPRSDRPRARTLCEPRVALGARRRLDADTAARQEPVSDTGAHGLAQGAGTDPRAVARARLFEGSDSRTLSQSRLLSARAPMASSRRRSAISANRRAS